MFAFREQYKVPTYYLLLLFLRFCPGFFLPARHQIKKLGKITLRTVAARRGGGGKAGLLLLLHFPSFTKEGGGTYTVETCKITIGSVVRTQERASINTFFASFRSPPPLDCTVARTEISKKLEQKGKGKPVRKKKNSR